MRQRILDVAFREIGTKESPANSNLQKYGEWFGLNGVAWCGIFCSWIYAQAGFPIRVDYLKGIAGVPYALAYYAKKGQLTNDPQPGDLVIFDWNTDHVPDHIAIFVKWLDRKNGIFATVEGNTSLTGSQSNGGEVMYRKRGLPKVITFVNALQLPPLESPVIPPNLIPR